MITWSHDVSAQPRSGAAMVVDVRATPVTNAASEAIDEHHDVGHSREVVGPGHVTTATDLLAPYATDWAHRLSGPRLAVVRPGSTAEVDQLTAGAGARLGDVQRHAAAAGWMYGVVLAARDSASIGGTVATNAGGLHAIAHGLTRAQLVGIEAVMPDGSVVSHLAGLLKDNTGYDIAALLCGSEDTLGVVHKLHVSVPLASLAQCADELRSVVDTFSGVTVFGVFGRLADGSIHVEIAAMRAIKRALDPAGLMNWGVLLEG